MPMMIKTWDGAVVIAALLCGATMQAQPPVPAAAQSWGRIISLVTEEGNFQTKWDTLEAARAASLGNSYNQTLKRGNEVVVLNSRCDGEVSYSLFLGSPAMFEAMQKLNSAALSGSAYNDAQQKLVDTMLVELQKNRIEMPSDCAAVAVEISFAAGTSARLEQNDVAIPLVGGRYNDAYVFEATRLGKIRSANIPGSTELSGGLINGFIDAKAALFAASQLAGTKIAVIKGDKIYLYRAAYALSDYPSDDAKLAALKAAKPASGFEILAMIIGSGANMKVMRTDGH